MPPFLAWILGGTGGAALLAAFLLNISNDANIAIKFAEQHGSELNQIRIQIAAIRLELTDRTKDRYTSLDAKRDREFIERRFSELESKLDTHRNQNGKLHK